MATRAHLRGPDEGRQVRGGGRAHCEKRALSSNVLRFAPNFSIYVLPPDVVCLYSEDRKFFLHGELYCALASAIGTARAFGHSSTS